ncbi:hypothetical protein BC829DRAFT_494647 [Chytridium lagenaria]|nr:hypothetical protein BC829DRAFT_494647 [Chytridium lagenaria]
MFPSLEAALCFDPPNPTFAGRRYPRSIIITDEVRADGAFLLHHFLGRSLRKSEERGAVLVGLNQSLLHHDAVARKLGYSARQSKNFRFVDCLPHLHDLSGPFYVKGEHDGTVSLNRLKSLYNVVISKVDELDKETVIAGSQGFLIVVDDLSSLLSMGFGAMDVFRFFMALREYIHEVNGTLVVLLHADRTTLVDVGQINLIQQIRNVCDFGLAVEGLESGFTDGVSGQLSIIRGLRLNDTKFIPQTLLYSVAETGVKFFAPGHVP